jgi:hypothetical protein
VRHDMLNSAVIIYLDTTVKFCVNISNGVTSRVSFGAIVCTLSMY